MTFVTKLKVGARGQITVPKNIRESLGISSNREVIAEIDNDQMIIKSVKANIAEKLKRMAEKINIPADRIKKSDDHYDEMMAEGLKLKLRK